MSKEMLGGCCVCSDERGWDENPLVYCDGQGCNVAVHQACYGIVTVPSGPWYCRKCELQERPRCELCPSKEGAFKKTDQNSWAHVVCALYIPEVRFGNVTTMEPILISLIPQERFNKTCYICEDSTRTSSKASFGACMQCNKSGCKTTFHVTCAQMLGLLCEEAGNMMDNVKYCGYCQHHYAKLVSGCKKTTRHMKIIPPFRPVPSNSSRSVSPAAASPEKAAHVQNSKSSGGSSSSSGEDGKSGSNNAPTHSSAPGSAPQGSSVDGGKSNNNISPDINSSCSSKNNKNGKKGSNYHGASGSKSSNNSMFDTKSGNTTSVTHDKGDGKGKSHSHGKGLDSDHHPSLRCEDNLTVKLERLDEKTAAKTGFSQKKDFSTIQLKEVVTAALDRPMSNTPGSKFDHTSSSLTSGLDGPSSTITATTTVTSTHSSRHSHGHPTKIAPPDIKPDVTLTPIPMKPNSSTRHSSSKDEERDLGDREGVSLSKSPGANLSFHHSFGAPPKLQNQQVSPDISDASSKGNKPPELTAQEDIPALDKAASGPPSKRARGMSRDEDREREQRRTPTKGRGGRRGTSTGSGSGYPRRECRDGNGSSASAVAFIDDSSFDEVIEANGSTNGSTEAASRGGRQPVGRKNGTVTRSSKPPEDPPVPASSQSKQSSQLGTETPPAGLAPHMFGNALNPSSSMAMKMVDTLSEEMEAVAAAGGVPEVVPVQTPLAGIPLPGTVKPPATTPSNGSSSSVVQTPPQTLEQLLERQWEQGSQFLMEQAQHLDIAQLLSCLNQLKQDNKALEEHVQSLIQRRDQLTAINARLSIPLGNSSALGSLGTAFGGPTNNNNHHNGFAISQSTPSPNVHPHPPQNQVPKPHPVSNSAPSPQQHDHVGQHPRERNQYINPELTGGRAELVVTHSSQNERSIHSNHQNHGPGHGGSHRSQMMGSNYGSYGGPHVPVVTSLSSPHSHPSSHPTSRDGR
ncbi:unnamed protein product [Orchesella dallaii]|uniref:Protein AF-10 n=1 Tax=Orchesella dallaii TaxID=48710 RepID=A0ABP1QW13_9HEXA